MVESPEYPEDATEPLQRGLIDELTDEPELDGALLEQARVELRESQIFPGVPLS